jgi:hypothetical protein
MSVISTCDCAASLAGALGGSMLGDGLAGPPPASPIADCPWCGVPSVEPELADVTSFAGLASRR